MKVRLGDISLTDFVISRESRLYHIQIRYRGPVKCRVVPE